MTSDPKIIFLPSGQRGYVPKGMTILEAARHLGVDLDSACGGRGICAKCQCIPVFGRFDKHGIQVDDTALSPKNTVETRYDQIRGLPEGRRLGCQSEIHGDMIIDIPEESRIHAQIIRKSLDDPNVIIDPFLRLQVVKLSDFGLADDLGYEERLLAALGLPSWPISPDLLGDLVKAVAESETLFVLYRQDVPDTKITVVQIWPKAPEYPICGVAVDLGSTTIAAYLCDLFTGEILVSQGIMNPQIRFGEDLMSRVSYTMLHETGAAEMSKATQEALDTLIGNLAQSAKIPLDFIFEITLVGNPVMHHLFLGLDPRPLGQAPFRPASQKAQNLRARDFGINIHRHGHLYIPPLIAGHVGADAAAVALASGISERDQLTLVCDIGTNAEILLGNKSFLYACSSPTGPAFEGAQISSGQRAMQGAIERATIDPKTKKLRFKIIGSEKWSDDPAFLGPVTGICGSGIIELVAEMRLAGFIDRSGLIGTPQETGSDRIIPNGRTHALLVYDPPEGGAPILVTNKDIREIQLAKAALYAGIRLLLDQCNIETVDHIILVGAFGTQISKKHAMILGIIPDCSLDRVQSSGNAAGLGALMLLLNRTTRPKIEKITARITRIETALDPNFQARFVEATQIPHACDSFNLTQGIANWPEPVFQKNATIRQRRRT